MMRLLTIPLLILFCAACGVDRDGMLERARVAGQAGDWREARSLYLSLHDANPLDADALEGLADASRALNDPEAEIEWSRALLELRPWDRDANLAVGRWHAENGRIAEAGNRLLLAYMDSVFKLNKKEIQRELIKTAAIAAQIERATQTP